MSAPAASHAQDAPSCRPAGHLARRLEPPARGAPATAHRACACARKRAGTLAWQDAHLAVWPAVDAVAPAHLLQAREADAEALRDLLLGEPEVRLQLLELNRALRRHVPPTSSTPRATPRRFPPLHPPRALYPVRYRPCGTVRFEQCAAQRTRRARGARHARIRSLAAIPRSTRRLVRPVLPPVSVLRRPRRRNNTRRSKIGAVYQRLTGRRT